MKHFLLVAAFGFLIVSPIGCGRYGPKVQHGNIEVHYIEGATRDEADRLGAYIVKQPGVAGERRSYQLRKAGDGYQMRMVIKEALLNNDTARQMLECAGARVSRDIFAGAAVEVHLCDGTFNTLKTLPPRADMRYGLVEGKVEVFFPADFDKTDAQNFTKYMAALFERDDALRSFRLARRDNIVEVHMVSSPKLRKNAEMRGGVIHAAEGISRNVFRGAPVEIHLCDEMLSVIDVIRP